MNILLLRWPPLHMAPCSGHCQHHKSASPEPLPEAVSLQGLLGRDVLLILGQISLLLALGLYFWLIDQFSLPRIQHICNTDGCRSTPLFHPNPAAVAFSSH